MKYRVTYEEKNGQPGKPAIFTDERLAGAYARSVRKGKVEPVEGDAPAAVVTTCKPADAAMVADATRRYYDQHWNPRRDAGRDVEVTDEHRAELFMETVTQARLCGASTSDALDDARDAAAAA